MAPGRSGSLAPAVPGDSIRQSGSHTVRVAAGVIRTDYGGNTCKPINKGLYSKYIPNPTAEIGHCVHHMAMNPTRPGVLFMQKHWDVMRSDNAGDQWTKISGNLPTDFGFVIVHSHEPGGLRRPHQERQ
jgi:hypothetical protein